MGDSAPELSAPPTIAAVPEAAAGSAPAPVRMHVNVREEMVQQGVAFLRHPKVQSTPLVARKAFLQRKGMTAAEIDAAIDLMQTQPNIDLGMPRVSIPSSAVLPYAVQWPGYLRVLAVVSSVVGATTILGFVWTFLMRSGCFPWLAPQRLLLRSQDEETEMEAMEQQEKAVVTGLQEVTKSMEEQTQQTKQLSSSIERLQNEIGRKTETSKEIEREMTTATIAELKAEVSTLKMLVLAQLGETTMATTGLNGETESVVPMLEADDMGKISGFSKVHEEEESKESDAERMETTLKMVRLENSTDQLKRAAGVLTMYVKNLVENPDVPRYRRIATANKNFKDKIEPLKYHIELLRSIGFESSGLNMEWRWRLIDKDSGGYDEHIAILKALLEALDALEKAKSDECPVLEDIAHDKMQEFYRTQTTERKEATSSKTTNNSGHGNATSDTNLDAFFARLQQKQTSSLSAHMEESSATQLSSDPKIEIKSKAKSETSQNDGPAYPELFAQVMEMVQNGETVPGIKEIEDRISDDAESLLKEDPIQANATAPTKPWETEMHAQTHVQP